MKNAKQTDFDWKLHASMCEAVLKDSRYLRIREYTFSLHGDKIRVRRWSNNYDTAILDSFTDVLDFMRDQAAAGTPQWEAICLLQGASYHRILEKGKELLAKLRSNELRPAHG